MQAIPLKQGFDLDVLSPLKSYLRKKGGLVYLFLWTQE